MVVIVAACGLFLLVVARTRAQQDAVVAERQTQVRARSRRR
jgi:hypothetical protein